MNYNRYRFINMSFFIASLCLAMERNDKPSLFKEITIVTNPRFVRYLSNNRIVIAGQYGCHIVNPITNEIIKKLNTIDYYNRDKISNVKISQNKKRIISLCDKTITGYNAENGHLEWSLTDDYMRSFDCDASGETIFVCLEKQGIKKYTYGIYQRQVSLYHPCTYFYSITINQNKKNVCISEFGQQISLFAFDDSSLTLQKEISSRAHTIKYSSDGLHIAANNELAVHIIDPNTDNHELICIKLPGTIKETAFHPNNLILATLSREITKKESKIPQEIKTSIDYWDIKNQQLIHTTALHVHDVWDLIFSDDGLQFIVVVSDDKFKNKCLSGSVPFKVKWHNKYPYFLFLLKNYFNQQQQEIPHDIVCYLMNLLCTYQEQHEL